MTVPAPGAPQAMSRPSLRRDIGWALALKAVALAILYLAFFGPSHQVAVTADRVASALIDPAPSLQRR
jgi:hypothetical protein